MSGASRPYGMPGLSGNAGNLGNAQTARTAGLSRTAGTASTSPSSTTVSGWDFTVGQAVMHDRFGIGVITELREKGDSAKAIVDFTNAGTKQLLLKFARLKKI